MPAESLTTETETPTESQLVNMEIPTESLSVDTEVPDESQPVNIEMPTKSLPMDTETSTEGQPADIEPSKENVCDETETSSTKSPPADNEIPIMTQPVDSKIYETPSDINSSISHLRLPFPDVSKKLYF